jgi:hypothetical protein
MDSTCSGILFSIDLLPFILSAIIKIGYVINEIVPNSLFIQRLNYNILETGVIVAGRIRNMLCNPSKSNRYSQREMCPRSDKPRRICTDEIRDY